MTRCWKLNNLRARDINPESRETFHVRDKKKNVCRRAEIDLCIYCV